jgi:O-antigen ligase
VVIAASFFAFRRRMPAVTRRSIRIGVIVFLVVASGALLWVSQLPSATGRFHKKSEELLALITPSGTVGGTAGRRVSFYRVALRAFENQPLLGHGVGSWGVLFYGEDRRTQVRAPHNLLLEVAAEEGLLGLTALGAFFLAAFGAMRKIRKSGPEFLFLLPIFAFCVLVSMFSSDIVNRPIWAWYAMVFVAARMIELRKPAPLANTVPVRRSGMDIALGAPVGASWKA